MKKAEIKEVTFLEFFFNSVFLAFCSITTYIYLILFVWVFISCKDLHNIIFGSIPVGSNSTFLTSIAFILILILLSIPTIIGFLISIFIDIKRSFKPIKIKNVKKYNINIKLFTIIRIINCIAAFVFIIFMFFSIPIMIISILR